MRLVRDPTTRPEGLELLGAYLSRGPSARFRRDAEVALASGLVGAGRIGDASALLDGVIAREGGEAPVVLRLLAAELALAARCPRALAMLDALVPTLRDHALYERALYDRGSARLHCGDAAAGRRDLEQVILRNPSGTRAGAARRALGH